MYRLEFIKHSEVIILRERSAFVYVCAWTNGYTFTIKATNLNTMCQMLM